MGLDSPLAAAIRGYARHPDAKIVVVSALGQKHILKDAFKLGATDFIVKPFDKHALANTLEQCVACGEPVCSA